MSTEFGKLEVVGVGENSVTLNLNRYVHSATFDNTTINVDTSKLNGNFYWLTNDVVESGALCDASMEVISSFEEKDTGVVREIKDKAAARCQQFLEEESGAENHADSEAKAERIATVSIFNGDSASTVNIDLNEEKEGITLADILHRHGAVEAACKCSL